MSTRSRRSLFVSISLISILVLLGAVEYAFADKKPAAPLVETHSEAQKLDTLVRDALHQPIEQVAPSKIEAMDPLEAPIGEEAPPLRKSSRFSKFVSTHSMGGY